MGDQFKIVIPKESNLFEKSPKDIIFSKNFHGSVPLRTREAVKKLVTKNYDCGIDREELINNREHMDGQIGLGLRKAKVDRSVGRQIDNTCG